MSTAYRDEEGALRERMAQLEVELDALRARSRELREAEAAEQRLSAEVAALRARIEELRGPAIQLEHLRIASPCKAEWSQMVGDDRVRYCGKCEKSVYDLSGMRRDEATAMIRERGGDLCLRLWRRADGTVLTADCPVGARQKKVRRLLVLAAGGTAMAAGAAWAFREEEAPVIELGIPGVAQPVDPELAMGQIEATPEPPGRPMMGAPMLRRGPEAEEPLQPIAPKASAPRPPRPRPGTP